MIREICRDTDFLSKVSEPASAEDAALVQDLLDTFAAHREECVGMAANMIGVCKRIIVFTDNGSDRFMLNPVILRRESPYEAEEGCLSLVGMRKRTLCRGRTAGHPSVSQQPPDKRTLQGISR